MKMSINMTPAQGLINLKAKLSASLTQLELPKFIVSKTQLKSLLKGCEFQIERLEKESEARSELDKSIANEIYVLNAQLEESRSYNSVLKGKIAQGNKAIEALERSNRDRFFANQKIQSQLDEVKFENAQLVAFRSEVNIKNDELHLKVSSLERSLKQSREANARLVTAAEKAKFDTPEGYRFTPHSDNSCHSYADYVQVGWSDIQMLEAGLLIPLPTNSVVTHLLEKVIEVTKLKDDIEFDLNNAEDKIEGIQGAYKHLTQVLT